MEVETILDLMFRTELNGLGYSLYKCQHCNAIWLANDSDGEHGLPPMLTLRAGWGCPECWGEYDYFLATVTQPWIDEFIQAMS